MKADSHTIVYLCGLKLEKTDKKSLADGNRDSIILTDSAHAGEVLLWLDGIYEEDLNLEGSFGMKGIAFCKAESQNDIMSGTLCIPRLLDVQGNRYRMFFLMGRHFLLLINDDGFARKLVKRIRRNKVNQGDSQVKFFYNFVSEFMIQDIALLENYERRLMALEEEVLQGRLEDFMGRLLTIRKSLMILRSYYEQMQDLANELEDNENEMFSRKQLRFFGVLAKRAERLYDKAFHLLDYAGQIRDVYQAQIDARQNRTMQFLTIISTIFLPLTLITSWYGMNFRNMPELETGYPYVIILCTLVVILSIWIFKRKKLF